MRKVEESPEGEAAEALPSGSGAKRVAMAVEERDVAKEAAPPARGICIRLRESTKGGTCMYETECLHVYVHVRLHAPLLPLLCVHVHTYIHTHTYIIHTGSVHMYMHV